MWYLYELKKNRHDLRYPDPTPSQLMINLNNCILAYEKCLSIPSFHYMAFNDSGFLYQESRSMIKNCFIWLSEKRNEFLTPSRNFSILVNNQHNEIEAYIKKSKLTYTQKHTFWDNKYSTSARILTTSLDTQNYLLQRLPQKIRKIQDETPAIQTYLSFLGFIAILRNSFSDQNNIANKQELENTCMFLENIKNARAKTSELHAVIYNQLKNVNTIYNEYADKNHFVDQQIPLDSKTLAEIIDKYFLEIRDVQDKFLLNYPFANLSQEEFSRFRSKPERIKEKIYSNRVLIDNNISNIAKSEPILKRLNGRLEEVAAWEHKRDIWQKLYTKEMLVEGKEITTMVDSKKGNLSIKERRPNNTHAALASKSEFSIAYFSAQIKLMQNNKNKFLFSDIPRIISKLLEQMNILYNTHEQLIRTHTFPSLQGQFRGVMLLSSPDDLFGENEVGVVTRTKVVRDPLYANTNQIFEHVYKVGYDSIPLQ